MWINRARKEIIENPEEIERVSQYRILSCISDYEIQGVFIPHTKTSSMEIRGIAGYKSGFPVRRGHTLIIMQIL